MFNLVPAMIKLKLMEKEVIPFILNPAAGSGRSLARIDYLRQKIRLFNLPAEIIISQSESHLKQLTRELAGKSEIIVGIGGDSTFHFMANEILMSGEESALGLIGLGSSNDIPRNFGLADFNRSLMVIKRGQKKAIDVAAILYKGQIVCYVLGQVNIGLGAAVNQHVASLIRRRPLLRCHQNLAGLIGIWLAYKNKENALPLSVQTKGHYYTGNFAIALFTNIRYWATGRELAPMASPDDGFFDLCLIRTCSLTSLLYLALLAKRGRHLKHKNIILDQSNNFLIASERKFVLQADGEIVKRGDKPFEVDHFELKVIPRALKIIA